MISCVDHCPKCLLGIGWRPYIDKDGKRYRRFHCNECGNVFLQGSEAAIAIFTEWTKDAERRHKDLLDNNQSIIGWFKGEVETPPYGMEALHEGDAMPEALKTTVTVKRSER